MATVNPHNILNIPGPHMLVCCPLYTHIFKKPTLKERLNALLSYKVLKYRYAEEEHTIPMDQHYEDACSAYMAEQKVRWALRRLVVIWLARRADTRAEPSIDLVTQEAVRQPIYVYDTAARRRYTFEARTLAQAIQANLLHQREGFPQAIAPKNIFTNEPFTYQQMASIAAQLQAAGRMNWPLAYYKECDFRLTQFVAKASTPITLRSLRDEICIADSVHGRDIVMRFIEFMVDEHEIPRRGAVLRLFEVALEVVPRHPVIDGFRALAYADMEAETLGTELGPLLTLAAGGLLEKRWLLKKVDAVRERL